MTKDKKLQIFEISDIHFGEHKSSEMLYYELKEIFYKKIKENIETLDMIVFAGDFWGTKLSLNSPDAKLGLQIINEIFSICNKKGIMIRMIRGTISHDYNQLNNFNYLKNKNDTFKIIDKVESEEFEVGNKTVKVLYIPEEYLSNPKEYYKKYLNKEKRWDLVFGHGTFDFAAFSSQKIESERAIKTAPILDADEFSNATKGLIVFGHIHIRDNKNLVYYSGSFSRLNFGEEEPKGFYEILYDPKSNDVELEFHENFLAPLYKTIKLSKFFDKGLKFTEDNIDLKINLIEKLKVKYKNSNLRIIDDTESASDLTTKILKERYNYDDDIKLKMESHDKKQERDPVYDFILNKEFTTSRTIQKYIKIKYGKKVPIAFINQTISDENNTEEE